MKNGIILALVLFGTCVFSQAKKIYESQIGTYYSIEEKTDLILKLDSFLILKTEKILPLFKIVTPKKVAFEFHPNEESCKCEWKVNTKSTNYERLMCNKENFKIEAVNFNASTATDSIYTKWGGFNKVILHHYIHLITYEYVGNRKIPKCLLEGVAIYLAEQLKFDREIKDIIIKKTRTRYIPSVNELLSDKKIEAFPNIYHWSFLFCKFIIDSYGWDTMLEILKKHEDLYEILGRDNEYVHEQWYNYLIKKYPDL